MAILGHPFYAGGHDSRPATPNSRGCNSCCATTTCRSSWPATRTTWSTTSSGEAPALADVHHFVNGGGGAYLSFGTALAGPRAADRRWAHYPVPGRRRRSKRHAVVEAARLVVDDELRCVAVLGRVAVGGVRRQRRAVLPELRRGARGAVGRSVRVLPYGVHGRLRWADVAASASLRSGRADESLVEWTIPMTR